MDQRLVGVNRVDDRLVNVDVDGIVAEVDETGYHHRTDVAATTIERFIYCSIQRYSIRDARLTGSILDYWTRQVDVSTKEIHLGSW